MSCKYAMAWFFPLLAAAVAAGVEGGEAAGKEREQMVRNEKALPRVLLIGDSITHGYAPSVKKLLEAKADVHVPPINWRSTELGLRELDSRLGDGDWDLIHFNWGLHDMKRKPTRSPVNNEASNGLKNLRGTIAMARTSDPHSATSQFFMNHRNNGFLDYAGPGKPGYAVFGKVVEGMEVVDAIAAVKTTGRAGMNDVPVEPVIIESAEFLEHRPPGQRVRMMYPIMVKIDFAKVIQAGRSIKPVGLTLFVNWAVKPFTMYAIALLFLGTLFHGFIGPDAVDYVKMPLGMHDLPVGAAHGAGTVVMHEGAKMLQVPLWRSYLAGCILLGIAPCTAMVLVWGYLAKGNDGHTLVMVAINSLTMLLLYGPLGGFLLGVGSLPVPWQALLLSIAIYVALPLAAGFVSRKWIIKAKGRQWFEQEFLHVLTPITVAALLATLVLLFSFKGGTILSEPLTILWIAVPLFIQTTAIFGLGYGLAKLLKLNYSDAAPTAMIGASNHFEVAIATATILFGLASGAALATVVGVLIEVPVMLMLVRICLKTRGWFGRRRNAATVPVKAR